MAKQIPVTSRASQIEYAIRDVVIPANALEAKGHKIIKLNIGDPLAYPGLPTPDHMILAYQKALLDQKNGYSPAYGIPELREAISNNEQNKLNGGWSCDPNDVYVCHGVTEALQIIFATFLILVMRCWHRAHTIHHIWPILSYLGAKQSNIDLTQIIIGK